jgi:hypothetical protein
MTCSTIRIEKFFTFYRIPTLDNSWSSAAAASGAASCADEVKEKVSIKAKQRIIP